jgi:nicotinamidase-related amidase
LVIDVQQGLFEHSTPVYQAEQLLDNICRLAEQAHAAGAPVVYIQHSNNQLAENTPAWQLHPRLHPESRDLQSRKTHGSAFEETALEAALDKLGVGALVITGLVSHGCVKATTLDAHRLGYRVTLVSDGHSNYHQKAAEVVKEWNEKLGEEVEVLPAEGIRF